MASNSESLDKDSEKPDNRYTRFIDDYYARKPKFTVAPDSDLPKHGKKGVNMPVHPKEEQSGDSMSIIIKDLVTCIAVANTVWDTRSHGQGRQRVEGFNGEQP